MVGVDTPFDLMKSEFGEYGETQTSFTAEDAKGFTKIYGNAIKIYHAVQKKNGKE